MSQAGQSVVENVLTYQQNSGSSRSRLRTGSGAETATFVRSPGALADCGLVCAITGSTVLGTLRARRSRGELAERQLMSLPGGMRALLNREDLEENGRRCSGRRSGGFSEPLRPAPQDAAATRLTVQHLIPGPRYGAAF